MRRSTHCTFPSGISAVSRGLRLVCRLMVASAVLLLLPSLNLLQAQTTDRVLRDVDSLKVQALPDHHPGWAQAGNDLGLAPPKMAMDGMTVVLARSEEQELALEKLLADQQDRASPDYHRWLTPAEMGERFGLSEHDVAAVTRWMQSQGLHVNWVSPSRIFIGFSGSAAEVGRAFRTGVHRYSVNGEERLSVASAPLIPEALAPAIKAVQGLYTIEDRPLHQMTAVQSASPELTLSNGDHFITPGDFATIYDLPPSIRGRLDDWHRGSFSHGCRRLSRAWRFPASNRGDSDRLWRGRSGARAYGSSVCRR